MNDIILEALEQAAEKHHEIVADHWGDQCCEQAPCIYCQAIAAIKETKEAGQ